MEVTEALKQALERVADLRHEQEQARRHLMQIQREVADAEAEAEVLARIAERYGLPFAGREPPLPHEVQEWQGLERTSAIERLLQEAGVSLSPKQIESALRDKGRDDHYHAVSAALAHLKRQGRVGQEERGRWTTPTKEPGEPSVQLSGIFADNYVDSYQRDTNEPAPRPESGAT